MAVGSRVSDYKVGDQVMAFGWNNNFADYFKSKAFQLQPVPEGLDMDIAALGEPTACAMYSGLNTGVQLGDTVVVMGGGYAGQIIAQCSKLKGAYQVIVVDVLEGKLNLAKSLGADVVINSKRGRSGSEGEGSDRRKRCGCSCGSSRNSRVFQCGKCYDQA